MSFMRQFIKIVDYLSGGFEMNENDLRVKKTREAIESSFLEMMKEKPLEKITVTALAKRARINKGTFYLHYQDIYDLHNKLLNQFFDEVMESVDYFSMFIENPEEFLLRFQETIRDYFDTFRLLLQKNSEVIYQQQLVEKMREKICQICSMEESTENNIKLDAVLNLLLYLLPKYILDYPDISQKMIVDIIKIFWKKDGNILHK